MDNKDFNQFGNDYCSPEEEKRYERPVYETAEEYNKARQEQSQASTYNQFGTDSESYYGNSNTGSNSESYYGNSNTGSNSESYYGNSNTGSNSESYYGNSNTESNSESYYGNSSSGSSSESYYGNSSSGSNSYGSSNYGNSSYGNGGYTNMGGMILDSNGKELKNRFGMKLTFSILEMLCCCASCITLIMGIISCIFTCQANTCFKEGRYDEFKSKAKVSTIMLIIGAVFAAFSILSTAVSVAIGWDDFMYEFENAMEEELGQDIDMDNFWEEMEDYTDEDYEDGTFSDYIEDADHENFEDFNEILVDGVSITLPCTYADLQAAGFYMDELDLNETVDAFDDEEYELHCQEKDFIASVQIVNDTATKCKAKDGMIIYLDFYYEGEEDKEIFDGIEFVNGLDVFGTVDETLKVLGEPNRTYAEDTVFGKQEVYYWEFEPAKEGYWSYVEVCFYDGVLYDIGVNNGPEEY